MLGLICVLILVLLIATPSLAQQSLVGTWKLVSHQREIDGIPDPMPGKPARGYYIITPKIYVMIQMDGTRKYGESAADKAALWETMTAIAGSYRIEGNKLVTIPDVHSNESWVGTEATTNWEIKGGRLILIQEPRPWSRDPSKKLSLRREYERID